MKKSILKIFLAHILAMVALNGCASVPTPTPSTFTPSPAPSTVTHTSISTSIPLPSATPISIPTETVNVSSIPILVSPFYDSEGIQINVGNYSQELKTNDIDELLLVAQEMAYQKEKLTPEQMFVLSIRLYDLGDKENSVYWFYEAQFRAHLFVNSLDPTRIGGIGDPAFELRAAYIAFMELAGGYINAFAGCDLDKWIDTAKMVKNDNPKPPELDNIFPKVAFVDSDQWQQINNDVAAGLDDLANYISDNKEYIKSERAANNLDAQFCE